MRSRSRALAPLCLPFAAVIGIAAAGTIVAGQTASIQPLVLFASRTNEAPVLDGLDDDPAWLASRRVTVTARGVLPATAGRSSPVTLGASYTASHLYLLASWHDATRDDEGTHSWKWDATNGAYVEDADREDVFGVAFQHTGPLVLDMPPGTDAAWDVWQWMAFRTNPQGHAMDRMHRFSAIEPATGASRYVTSNGTETWITRPQDAGDPVGVEHPAPRSFTGDRVPRYSPGRPTGSAADVAAKGAWVDGVWTVEFARRLDTGNPDDTSFNTTRSYRMSISVHDRTSDRDRASRALVLRFRPQRVTQ